MTHVGTALVATAEDRFHGRDRLKALPRPPSAFTAQLLAIRLDSPEYRERRRIAPAIGVAAYGQRLQSLGPSLRGIHA